MTIRDMTEQFTIQGMYCVKKWIDDLNDCVIFAEGNDFECEYRNLECLDNEIIYMYALDGILNIEIK